MQSCRDFWFLPWPPHLHSTVITTISTIRKLIKYPLHKVGLLESATLSHFYSRLVFPPKRVLRSVRDSGMLSDAKRFACPVSMRCLVFFTIHASSQTAISFYELKHCSYWRPLVGFSRLQRFCPEEHSPVIFPHAQELVLIVVVPLPMPISVNARVP